MSKPGRQVARRHIPAVTFFVVSIVQSARLIFSGTVQPDTDFILNVFGVMVLVFAGILLWWMADVLLDGGDR